MGSESIGADLFAAMRNVFGEFVRSDHRQNLDAAAMLVGQNSRGRKK
jgi:hypothetical protein